MIKEDLKPFISPLVPFIDNFGASFTIEEFVEHFYYAGFPLSQAAKPFDSKDAADTIPARN